MKAFRSRLGLAVAALAVALATAADPAALAQTDAPPDTHLADPALQDLERIDGLLHDGRYAEAEDAARQRLTGLENVGRGRALAAAWYSDRLVEALLGGGRGTRQETIDRARLAVAIKETELGAEEIEAGRSLDRLGRVLTRTASFAEANDVLNRSLDIAHQGGANHAIDHANALRSLGQLSCAQGKYAVGHARLNDALEIQRSLVGEDSTVVAMTALAIGECYVEQRDPIGQSHTREALRHLEATLGSDHPAVARALTSLGLLLTLDGRFAEARDLLERALAIYDNKLGPDSPASSATLTWQGRLLTVIGEYSAANEAFERALSIRTREYGPLDRQTADTRYEQSVRLMRMGDFDEAERTLERVASVRERLLGPEHSSVADALNMRGLALAVLGAYDPESPLVADAESLMLRALMIRTGSLGANSFAVANSLMTMANMLYEPAGKYAQALSFGQRSLEILESSPEASEFNIYYSLYSLAVASRGLGDLKQALAYSERAIRVRERVFGKTHPASAGMLGIQAQLLFEAGQFAQVADISLSLEGIVRDHLELVARTAPESEALSYARHMPHGADLLLTLTGLQGGDTWVESAWNSVLQSRGLVLNEISTRRRISLQVSDRELARLWDDLNDANRQLAKLVVTGPAQSNPAEFDDMMAAVRDRKDRAERAFAAANAEYRETFGLGHAGLAEVTEALPPDTALVAFVTYTRYEPAAQRKPVDTGIPSYAAFVKTPGGAPRVVLLGDAEAIERGVARWREAMTRPSMSAGRAKAAEPSYRAEAAELRKAIWDPIARQLGSVGHVFIVPEGALHTVSFASLPTGESQYLAETGPILHYLSSERDVLRSRPSSTHGGLLALGAPDFDSTGLFAALHGEPAQLAAAVDGAASTLYRGPRSACGSFQEMSFEALPEAAEEIAEILELWRDTGDDQEALVLSGAEATESRFKHNAAGKRVLHIATHGFFLGGECGSALDPRQGDDITGDSPLLLSGLVLAGANHRAAAGPDEDDGILTAEEIATLDLRDTEWAVLSACDTGRGEIHNGEGVFGLQRAFRVAGAHTTIMSLWPIEDAAARWWMTALYRKHFAEGRSTADAVHGATVDLLAQRRAAGLSSHPFYWAGFVASGDWR